MAKVKKDNGVICGTCNIKFANKKKYLEHTCKVTGYTPRDPEHFGTRFMAQSKKALERTGSLTPARKKQIDDKIKKAKKENIDDKIMRAAL